MKNKILIYSLLGVFAFQSCINDDETPIAIPNFEGEIVNPNVGGAAQPNQIWFELSSGNSSENLRTKWDLGFYCGDEFKVILNSSALMAAGKIENATDINAISETLDILALEDEIQVANFVAENEQYVDNPAGNISGHTAIAEISENDSENGIYLVNMGNEINTENIPLGSAQPKGDARGWMKIQITRNADGYKIKYADINATTYKEYIIQKNPDYNFVFFSLIDNQEVMVQPEKKHWDICFTVFVNILSGAGSYIYSDFVTTNILSGVGAYQVKVPAGTNATEVYNNFSASDVDESKFIFDDQTAIGSTWRFTGPSGNDVYGDRFYIIKNTDGLYYKLKFNRMTNLEGVRGNPEFEYKPL
ncbi:MAG: hypothetical protein LBE36_05030 [Flavobacteriaceae bacterium]|jgi:hypothetical protein|nr:hypothetical protein [Flavobacteriaceae bacterium]